jgi:DNA primase
MYAEYLEGRGFNPHDIADKYNLWFGGITGHWKFRIIIPMMMDGKVVSFTGRAIGNKINPRYLNLNIQKSIVPVKKALYNIDNAGDSVIVVEGPTDVWRIGDGAVAIMGTKYCERQVKELMKFRNVFVMLDNEPQTVPIAEQLAADLSTCCNYVEIINIPEMTDPGELSNEDVRSLRSQLFKKIY